MSEFSDPTQSDLKNTWLKLDFFYQKQKRVDLWPNPIFYGSTRPNLDNSWPDLLKKFANFFLKITSWY